MTIIKIEPNENGSHDNQTINNVNHGAFYSSKEAFEILKARGYSELKFKEIDGKKVLIGAAPFPIPEGYAILPDTVGTPESLENYPFGEITVEDVIDIDGSKGLKVVTSWTPLPVPEPEPGPEEPQYTDLQLLAQQVTDLELMVLGGVSNV